MTGWLTIAAVMVLAACSWGCLQPSVQSKVEDSRAEIVQFIGEVKALREKLPSAPTERKGFAPLGGPKVTSANTVVVAEVDFDALRTDIQSSRTDNYEWHHSQNVSGWSSNDLGVLVDRVRALPMNPPDRGQGGMAVIDRALAMMRATAYVAVVRTDEAKNAEASGNTFTGGRWVGSVFVWDIAHKAWIGAVTVEVVDHTFETHLGGDPAKQLNYRLNKKIEETVRSAIQTGSSTKV